MPSINEEVVMLKQEVALAKQEVTNLRDDMTELRADIKGLVEAWKAGGVAISLVKLVASLVAALSIIWAAAKFGLAHKGP